MTHVEHTPGPWSHHDLRGDRTKFSIVHNGPIAYVGDNTAGPDNCEANARVIAAAPELLAALRTADRLLGQFDDNAMSLFDFLERIRPGIRAAIAKATGGT